MQATTVSAKVETHNAVVNVQQQGNEKTIQGVVLDETGAPVIGATVVVKGTKTVTVTDIDGNFSLKAPVGSTIVITYIGYNAKEVAATTEKLSITMQPNTNDLEEVVVTALGIKRAEKALSYNVQQVKWR